MPTKQLSSYLFLGEEDFLKEEAINNLASKFLDKGTKDLNCMVFRAKEKGFDAKEMFNFLNTQPFLSKNRLAVLKDADYLDAPTKEEVISYLKSPRESSVFVIESISVSIKGPFLLELSKLTNLFYYRRLNDAELEAWVAKKARFYNKKIGPGAVSIIKDSLPNDMRILSSNVDKLVLYAGTRQSITREDVIKVIGRSPSSTVFDLIDAVRKKEADKALDIFSSFKKDKKKEIEFIGLLAWNIRMFLRIQELFKLRTKSEICKDLDLNPRAFDVMTSQASRFKSSELLNLLKEVLAADLKIKTGNRSTSSIEELLVKACSS
ncbi:MAG: DNA polymerase III subunit delta [Candidatus Omnitrophota bacterium]